MTVAVESKDTFTRKWQITWEFEADLINDSTSQVISDEFKLDLPGVWKFFARRSDKNIELGVEWVNAVVGCVTSSGGLMAYLNLRAVRDSRAHLVDTERSNLGVSLARKHLWAAAANGLACIDAQPKRATRPEVRAFSAGDEHDGSRSGYSS